MKQKPMHAADVEKLVLDRAKRGLAPSPQQRKQTLTRLGLALESLSTAALLTPQPSLPNTPLGHDPGEPVSGAATSIGRFSLQSMVVGVVTGMVVGFGAGVVVSSTTSPSGAPPSSRARSSAAHHELAPARLAERKQPTTPPQAIPAPPQREPTSPQQARALVPARTQRHEQRLPVPPTSPSAEMPKATFYEELSYVRRAQSALQQGNPTLALGLMQSLDEVQPNGALLAERNMTQVLSLCQLGRAAEAGAIANRMLTGGTADVYRRRLARSCAGGNAPKADEQQTAVKDPVE